MCLGGHLAYRCALDSRIKAAVCYFATDIHSKTLALGKNDDSLARAGDIKGELLMVRNPIAFIAMNSPLPDLFLSFLMIPMVAGMG
jgi:dienelactone hydrolase